METSLNTLSSIGSNYYVRLNDKEILIYEEDDSNKKNKTLNNEDLEKKSSQKSQTDNELSQDEKRLVKDLQSRDSEVKAHEAAHQAAGGGMTGAASYTYQQGPDGKMYAIGGEVSISMKSGSSPQETIKNARQVVAAAMAAGNPSPQDFAVASSAMIMEMKAQQKLAKMEQEELLGKEVYGNKNNLQEPDNKTSQEPLDISA